MPPVLNSHYECASTSRVPLSRYVAVFVESRTIFGVTCIESGPQIRDQQSVGRNPAEKRRSELALWPNVGAFLGAAHTLITCLSEFLVLPDLALRIAFSAEIDDTDSPGALIPGIH